MLRDKRRDYLGAFKTVADCITGLLEKPGAGWLASLIQPTQYSEIKPIRREIWAFTRNPDQGLPASSLAVDTEWHPHLVAGDEGYFVQATCRLRGLRFRRPTNVPVQDTDSGRADDDSGQHGQGVAVDCRPAWLNPMSARGQVVFGPAKGRNGRRIQPADAVSRDVRFRLRITDQPAPGARGV